MRYIKKVDDAPYELKWQIVKRHADGTETADAFFRYRSYQKARKTLLFQRSYDKYRKLGFPLAQCQEMAHRESPIDNYF